MPSILSIDNQRLFITRLAEYVRHAQLTQVTVVFHGGEPLLAGAESLSNFATQIKAASPAKTDIGIQTNGTLLTDSALYHLENAGIGISLSLDGPRIVNDKHRLSHRGLSTFDRTFDALQRLEGRPSFSGVISVIDPYTPPDALFSFFASRQLPKLDFLLPDAHHLCPPPGRQVDRTLYERWLIRAFDIWIDRFPNLAVRTFESILDVISGLPSTTDAFGFGDVSLITIETDGSYHDLDTLKITRDGATSIGRTMANATVADIAASAPIAEHRRLLRKDGLCGQCQQCRIVDTCGGGSLPHRFGPNGFDHPTIYCQEMLALVDHVRRRMSAMIQEASSRQSSRSFGEVDLRAFEQAEYSSEVMHALRTRTHEDACRDFVVTLTKLSSTEGRVKRYTDTFLSLSQRTQEQIVTRPGAVAWRRAIDAQLEGRRMLDVDGKPIIATSKYLEYLLSATHGERQFAVGEPDPWLRVPFGSTVVFEGDHVVSMARTLIDGALSIIQEWRPRLCNEIRSTCRAIQFIHDPMADSDKIVSFSDNSVPGAIYVSVVQGHDIIDAYDLADSLIHEHRHQKLYLLENSFPIAEVTDALFESPWRDDLRPATGLLHAAFVFVELRRFWMFVYRRGPRYLRSRAFHQLGDTHTRLSEAFVTLRRCPLTSVGRELSRILQDALEPNTDLSVE